MHRVRSSLRPSTAVMDERREEGRRRAARALLKAEGAHTIIN